MTIAIKWCGIDFGQCLMDPSGLRNPLFFGDICKELGEPELINERVKKYRILKEKYGSYGAIKEGHRDEILSYVFDNNQEAMNLFSIKEQELLKPAEGVEQTLVYLKEEGIILCVVAELKKTLGPMGSDIVTRFLQRQNLTQYFSELITPQGKVNLKDGSVDMSYKGLTKEEGTLYDRLAEDLLSEGIEPSEAVIIVAHHTGDRGHRHLPQQYHQVRLKELRKAAIRPRPSHFNPLHAAPSRALHPRHPGV